LPNSTFLFGAANAGYRRTWAWATLLLVPVFLISGQILFLLPAKLLGWITVDNVETYPHILHLIIGAFAIAALIFILWIRFFERRDLASVGLGLDGNALKRFVRGFVSGLVMAAAVVYAVRLFGGYSVEAETQLALADLAPIAILLFAFILQSGTEELIFRGWMMGRLAERYGLWVGVVGNSILFTLMHVDIENVSALGVSGIAIFTTATLLFSIFLSLLVIRERSIWGAAAWHAAWNWMFITWFGLPTTGIELGLAPLAADYMPAPDAAVWLTGGTDGPEGSVFTPAVLVVGSLVLAHLIRSRHEPSALA
jgi:membrane protease YdiL (CAAX protease family)